MMQSQGINPDKVALASTLIACSHSGCNLTINDQEYKVGGSFQKQEKVEKKNRKEDRRGHEEQGGEKSL